MTNCIVSWGQHPKLRFNDPIIDVVHLTITSIHTVIEWEDGHTRPTL
jgi:hypothetical protein